MRPWVDESIKIYVRLSTRRCATTRRRAGSGTLNRVTAAATRFDDRELEYFDGVAARAELRRVGIAARDVASQIAARRWQAVGSAVLLHNAAPTVVQKRRIAAINCGPRAVLTSFTAAEEWGLRGWEREEIHVLAPAGTRRPRAAHVVLHRSGDWRRVNIAPGRGLHLLAPALVLAGSSFRTARPACGLLAAAVQQRLTTARELTAAVTAARRTRHRASMLAALADVAQGAQALSEIDFVRLCRRYGLPEPTRQAMRVEPDGRRRHLDAEWRLPGGRVVAAEVDGALHLTPQRWYDDQLRQNEIVIGGALVLRYPSVVVRDEPLIVVTQLRRVLLPIGS